MYYTLSQAQSSNVPHLIRPNMDMSGLGLVNISEFKGSTSRSVKAQEGM